MPASVPGGQFDLIILEQREGFIVFKAEGKKVEKIFAHESGGHRHQRVPPTERKGRVHTSTITVVVLPPLKNTKFVLQEKDLDWSMCRASGAGGQHVNKTSSAVQLKHRPTGMQVRVESRSQHQNKQDALDLLARRLEELERNKVFAARDQSRKAQAGTGMRGNKIRTIRQQDDIVTDHILNKRISFKEYQRGIWDGLID